MKVIDFIIDAFGITGLLFLAAGLYRISFTLMLVVFGAILIAFSLSASRGIVSFRNPYKTEK